MKPVEESKTPPNMPKQYPLGADGIELFLAMRELKPDDRHALLDCLAAYLSQPEPRQIPIEVYLAQWQSL